MVRDFLVPTAPDFLFRSDSNQLASAKSLGLNEADSMSEDSPGFFVRPLLRLVRSQCDDEAGQLRHKKKENDSLSDAGYA
jgi:hypothetical protein